MTELNLTELRKVAEAVIERRSSPRRVGKTKALSEFALVASPPTVLALLDRVAELEAVVGRVEAFSREMRGYCSPHGVSATYADRLDGVLDGRDPIERLREKLSGAKEQP